MLGIGTEAEIFLYRLLARGERLSFSTDVCDYLW